MKVTSKKLQWPYSNPWRSTHSVGIYAKATASSWGWQDCHAWEIGEISIYSFLQVGELLVGNLCKYLLTQEVKFYLSSEAKYALLCW